MSEEAIDDPPQAIRAEGAWEGWKEIAEVLRVDRGTAMGYARRDYDPLPVRVDHAGRYYIYKAALASWVNRQDLPIHAYDELARRDLLPGQLRRAERSPITGRKNRSGPQRVGMTKAAKRNRAVSPKPYAAAATSAGRPKAAR